jgi:hypothetical protein
VVVDKKQYLKKLEDLNRSLGECNHRRSAMFPGPGIDEDEKYIKALIKELKRMYRVK